VLKRTIDESAAGTGLAGTPSAAPEPAADAGEAPERREPRYDRAFREAVEAGFLTPKQAFERGKREVLAARLSDKHHLPRERALAVADNRISLLSAIRERKAGSRAPVQLALPASSLRTRAAWMVPVALLAVIAVWLFSAFVANPELEQVRQLDGGVRIHTDPDGHIVRIEGLDPRSVLDAYCESGGPGRESLGLNWPAGGESDLTLGILRDRSAPEDQLAIYISADRSGARWTAGNGRSPLVAFQAPSDAAKARQASDSR